MYINVELLQGDYCNEKGISYYSLIFPMFQTQDMKYTGDFCNENGICYYSVIFSMFQTQDMNDMINFCQMAS